jgi:WXG100 family type VII secretion target
MAAPKVRADYDQLKDTAARFGGQAQAARQSLQALQQAVDVLQAGDWMGQGATAFYQEMGGQVLPTLKRLAAALETAQQTTTQISAVMAQAEAEAARVLHANGSGASTAGAPGMAAFVGAGGVGGGTPAGGGAAGGVAAGATGGSPAAGTRVAGPSPLRDAVGKIIAEENAAADKLLKDFSPGVQALVKQSPTLRAQMLAMDKAKFHFALGAAADGYFMDPKNSEVRINSGLSDLETVRSIAHEVGHVVFDPALVQEAPGMTRDHFVAANTAIMLRNEGEAQFNVTQVRDELMDQGFPDIGINGAQDAEFLKTYQDYRTGKINRDDAVQHMGDLMATEHSSRPPRPTYAQYYRDYFEKDWEDYVDLPPSPPPGAAGGHPASSPH